MKNKPDEMERVRAAVPYLNGRVNTNDGSDLAAFMSIFHPEVDTQTVKEMIRDRRKK